MPYGLPLLFSCILTEKNRLQLKTHDASQVSQAAQSTNSKLNITITSSQSHSVKCTESKFKYNPQLMHPNRRAHAHTLCYNPHVMKPFPIGKSPRSRETPAYIYVQQKKRLGRRHISNHVEPEQRRSPRDSSSRPICRAQITSA